VTRLAALAALLFALLAPAAHAVEPNGALIRVTSTGYTYRIVGGAPLRISSCAYTNGCDGRKDVANLNGYRTTPADGAMIYGGSDGGVYRFAGGAPLWISSCGYGGGCAAKIQVDNASFKDTAHVRALPANSTVIRNAGDGGFYRFAGGAPLLVRCDIGAGCVNPPQFDNGTFTKFGTATPATPHMRQYPANGTVVVNADDNSFYRFAGNAPLPVSPVASGQVIVDARTFVQNGTALASLPHMQSTPADNTFLVAAPAYYRMAGGAAVRLSNCAVVGNCAGAVAVDPGTISGLGGGRLRAAPKDGTVLRGLPSNTLWEIVGGFRRQTFVNVAGVGVDDGALGLISTGPAPAPAPPPAAPAVFAPVISSTYTVNRKGTRFRTLRVRDVPDGSRVLVTCNSRRRGCPFKSKRFKLKHGRANLVSRFRHPYLKNKARVIVKITGPTGARKYMTFAIRKRKLPIRHTTCARPGAKLGRC
jgi:hypothetical protein